MVRINSHGWKRGFGVCVCTRSRTTPGNSWQKRDCEVIFSLSAPVSARNPGFRGQKGGPGVWTWTRSSFVGGPKLDEGAVSELIGSMARDDRGDWINSAWDPVRLGEVTTSWMRRAQLFYTLATLRPKKQHACMHTCTRLLVSMLQLHM